MEKIAVIDTETNWDDRVMSIGVAVGEGDSFTQTEARYYILTREAARGGMYSHVLQLARPTRFCTRQQAMEDLKKWLASLGVTRLFAYNARFDRKHMPELEEFSWFDIMALAAYRQYNPAIPPEAPCCRTGRLRSCYGVEPILRLLSGCPDYRETHNALYDAADELKIMRYLQLPLENYECARL